MRDFSVSPMTPKPIVAGKIIRGAGNLELIASPETIGLSVRIREVSARRIGEL